MLRYVVEFNDGEHIATFNTKDEAMDLRNKENFNYFSRSIHVYEIATSRVTNLYSCKKIV